LKNSIKHIYFIGIGGIGMSALARYFNQLGVAVYGYDKTPSQLTKTLNFEGIPISFEDNVNQIPEDIVQCKTDSLVVYTPAIPKDNVILNFFKQNSFDLRKRAEVLGMVTSETINLSVAGTHGKTTTSCIVATILQHSKLKFSAFLGGISTNLGSNYHHQEGESEEHYSVTEADEFDRSFLRLNPDFSVITSTDADHLDIYGNAKDLQDSYIEFSKLIEAESHVFYAYNKAQGINGLSYSATSNLADYYAHITSKDGRGTQFSIQSKTGDMVMKDLYLNIPGTHNLENAIGASLMTFKAGVDVDSIRKGLKEFSGIKRRFEYVIDTDKVIYIDDYAHHPSELNAIISSVRELYPNKKITAVFQPHLYSRTRDFIEDFGNELSQVDELFILPIYPARELPIAGVTSEALLEETTLKQASCIDKNNLVDALKHKDVEILLTLGAGDIDRLVEPIKKLYGH
jgi:UDP-N-acetylmuramate--alanine ligase